ncbi:hypothetical protein U3D69_004726 [Salmonella enterica]|nr:hypothetical protein [Salmonella enterica subsp. enterica]EJY2238779.1 hypothetical protein [Salmonella enterica]EDX0561063.1 hypothetical protein [Salmonella enterica subsp. enterica]EDX0932684.1 hypothetical protein [Salmonella enterica subsp. enterica]ELP6174269.1 hypothetical protein [Salmonella enterica]
MRAITPLSPARPISGYQTMFSLSQLARELANGTPGQCETLARGAVSARYEMRSQRITGRVAETD